MDIKELNSILRLVEGIKKFIGSVPVNNKETKYKVGTSDWANLYLDIEETYDRIKDYINLCSREELKHSSKTLSHNWNIVCEMSTVKQSMCEDCKLIKENHFIDAAYNRCAPRISYHFEIDSEHIYIERDEHLINKCSKIPYKVFEEKPEYFSKFKNRLYNLLEYVHNAPDWKLQDYGAFYDTPLGINRILYYSTKHKKYISIPYETIKGSDYEKEHYKCSSSKTSIEFLECSLKKLASTNDIFDYIINNLKETKIGKCCHPAYNQQHKCIVCSELNMSVVPFKLISPEFWKNNKKDN